MALSSSCVEGVNRRITVQASLGINARPYWNVAQVVEYLTGKFKALSSNPSTSKKNK
jgi:phosphotransferase system HPr-like phosphotransfer protein